MLSKLLPLATRHYPFHTPRASLLDILPPIPQQHGEFTGKRGFRYRSIWETNDPICRSLYWLGDFDPWVNEAIERLCTAGSIALDIGANIGATALVLARAVGPDGKVFCFEPMPENAAKLRTNLAANDFSWANVEQIALSSSPGEVTMGETPGGAGTARITDSGTTIVRTEIFDDWASQNGIRQISVCKIDVEGHENHVFAGMRRALSEKLIGAFVFERHNVEDEHADEILAMLSDAGYQLFRIEKGLMAVYYSPLGGERRARKTTDFVAVLPQHQHMLTRPFQVKVARRFVRPAPGPATNLLSPSRRRMRLTVAGERPTSAGIACPCSAAIAKL